MTNERKRDSLMDKIPYDTFGEGGGIMDIYRLGIFDGESFNLVEMHAGQEYPVHVHHNSDARLCIVIGEGIIILNGREIEYRVGDSYGVRRGMSHGFKPRKRTLFLSIQKPPIKDPRTGHVDVEYIG